MAPTVVDAGQDLGSIPSLAAGPKPAALLRRRLRSCELVVVHCVAATARGRCTRMLAVLISRLGNGWLYAIILGLVYAKLGRLGLPVVLAASLNVAVAHLCFSKVKRGVGRARPFVSDASLRSLLPPVDQHSFPSGHTMTLTATLIPIIHTSPGLYVLGAGTISAMCWARVASAHHYVSDVLFGILFGSAVGYPITAWILR